MDKKSLWDKFIQTGKVSDYLKYSRAVKSGTDIGEDSLEIADEFYPGEDINYDNQDGRYSNP